MQQRTITHFGRFHAEKTRFFVSNIVLFLYFPFSSRILVPSDAVGAIIGKQGSTIKQIKQATHAKYDKSITFLFNFIIFVF